MIKYKYKYIKIYVCIKKDNYKNFIKIKKIIYVFV